MLKGEYQAGIPPYGYQKDKKIKNHLIIDKKVVAIVQEIFDLYVNKNMSTIKIANEFNKRKIPPPGVYLNLPITKKKKSKFKRRVSMAKCTNRKNVEKSSLFRTCHRR